LALLKIVYSSQPFGYDEAMLAGILMDARRCNARDDVTGALICRREVFLQLLEGPERQVRDAFQRIGQDDRHLDIVLHVSEPVSERMFGNWAMLHDPARSWLLSETETSGDCLDRVRSSNVRGIFEALAAELQPNPID
jgi:Sensors of blue-light using FAD